MGSGACLPRCLHVVEGRRQAVLLPTLESGKVIVTVEIAVQPGPTALPTPAP